MCVFRPNEDFYKQFGSVMLRRYANVSGSLPETAAEAFAAGIKPTFQQFITYLLDPETERESIFNEHWRQVFISQSSVKPHLMQLGIIHELMYNSPLDDHIYAVWDFFQHTHFSMRPTLFSS